jgi:hypothetical protein
MSREDFINFSGFTQPGRLSLPRASTSSSSSASGDVNAQGGMLPIANIGRIMQRGMPEKRRTINRDGLIWSMGMVSFEDYVEPLKL